jgi:CheY-like chemotaxis protein
VVDDSAVDRRLAGMLLEKHFDCTVHYAANGKEALQHLAHQLPDLVVADLQMPEMDGLQLVTAVRFAYPFVPVVLMTAQGSEDIAAEALRKGAASYVPKRKLAVDLVPTVQRILLGSFEDRGHTQLMHYLESSETVFVLGNDLALIKSLVHHLQEMLRCLPLSDETERLRVGIALEEALFNACYHGNLEVGRALGRVDRQAYEDLARQRLWEEPYSNRHIRVTTRINREQAVFTIRDDGPGFDFAAELAAAAAPDTERAAGRGIILIRSIMDEVRYTPPGNEVTLIKRRAPEPEAHAEEGTEGEAP